MGKGEFLSDENRTEFRDVNEYKRSILALVVRVNKVQLCKKALFCGMSVWYRVNL